jgi:hypothetical protein
MVQAVLAARMRVVPQAYTGNMGHIAENAVYLDLLARGFPESSISLFYDAALFPIQEFDGFAFTMGRLPR